MNGPSTQSDHQAAGRSLTSRTASGFAWMFLQTIITKAVDVVVLVILGKLLLDEDFGLVGIAVAARVFTDLLRRLGLGQVLVQRQANFRRWATPGFWMALAIGIIASMLMIGIAPIVAIVATLGAEDAQIAFEQQKELRYLIWVLAAIPPVVALGIVPRAKLESQLRFRALATTELSVRVTLMLLRVVLALFGLGAMAFILPEPIVEAGRTIAYWVMSKPKIRPKLLFRRWRFLLRDSMWIFGGSTFVKIVEQVDYLIIGLFHAMGVVGGYFFAYSLSVQTLRLFATNLENVLLPVLSHLQFDLPRQISAYLRATRLMAFMVIPICFMQAALFGPILKLFFSDGKWDHAIAPGQILSIGMAMWVLYGPTASLIKSQGRFRTFAVMSFLYAIAFVTAITIAAAMGASAAVAIAVAVCMTLYGPTQMYVGIRPGGGTWSDVFKTYVPPLSMSAVTMGTVAFATSFIPDSMLGYIAQIGVMIIFGGGSYALAIRLLAPEVWNEGLALVGRFLPGRFQSKPAASDSA